MSCVHAVESRQRHGINTSGRMALTPPAAICYYSGNILEDAMTDFPIARRTVIAGAGAGLVAGLVADEAAAQPKPEIVRTEYSAKKGDTRALQFSASAIAPKAGDAPRPVLFLVHGSSNSAGTSYDLTRAGQGRILGDERHGRLRLRRVEHGPRRLRPLRLLGQLIPTLRAASRT